MKKTVISMGEPMPLVRAYANAWKASGRTQQDLAELLGTSPQILSRAVLGYVGLPLHVKRALCLQTGVTLDAIMTEEERLVWEVKQWR